jgi:hypothetical protein
LLGACQEAGGEVTVSTDKRVDMVHIVSAMLERLTELGGRENERVFYTYGSKNTRLDNCRKVRRKLMELLDESGVAE